MRRVFIAMFLALIPVLVWGQKASDLVYTDARELMLINQGFDNTELYYSRLPLDMKDAIRKAVWDLGLNSAGLAIRFSTNAKAIGARWTLLNNFNMAHMAGTGIRGIDLYFLDENDTWRFIGTAQPNGKESSNVFVRNMSGQMRDYMAYLPSMMESFVSKSGLIPQRSLECHVVICSQKGVESRFSFTVQASLKADAPHVQVWSIPR